MTSDEYGVEPVPEADAAEQGRLASDDPDETG
jgi:hypothetical protein